MNKKVITFLLATTILYGCSRHVIDLPQPHTKKEQEREDIKEINGVAPIKKNILESSRLKTCLDAELNYPMTSCIYTDTILEEMKDMLSKVSKDSKEYKKCRINKNSQACFNEALFHAFLMKNGFIHLQFGKNEEGEQEQSVKKTKISDYFFDAGLINNMVKMISTLSNHYKTNKIPLYDIEWHFKHILERCSPQAIEKLEIILKYLKKNSFCLKQSTDRYVEKNVFSSIMKPTKDYFLLKAVNEFDKTKTSYKFLAQAEKEMDSILKK